MTASGAGGWDSALPADRGGLGEFALLYGPWLPHTPADVAALFAGYPGRWWVAGGWAIEAFTGVARPHADTDAGIVRSDLALLRRHLAGHFHVWQAGSGSLTPLPADDRPDADPDEVLLPPVGQVWLRRDALSRWEYDVLLTPGTQQEWVYKRDERVRLPWAEALWELEGIPYLRPEVQLLMKAPGLREKDQADFEACLPLLDGSRRRWLADALALAHPGHTWEASLGE